MRARSPASPPHDGPRLVDRIRLRKVADLVLNPRNSRTHTPEQVAQLVASIKQFGFTMPVLIDEAGMLIAGHGRVLAAQRLGMAKVPTIDGSYMSEAEKRAYMIADNQLGLTADWDLDMLSRELGELGQIAGFDLGVLGFSDDDLLKFTTTPEPETPAPPGQRRPGRDRAESPVVQYNIVFDDDAQQQLWFGLLRKLKLRYPDHATIAARLAAFIEAQPE
jgi:hypothetical protein